MFTTRVPRLSYFPERELGKYHNLGMSVVNIVCHGHEYNILFITVELLN